MQPLEVASFNNEKQKALMSKFKSPRSRKQRVAKERSDAKPTNQDVLEETTIVTVTRISPQSDVQSLFSFLSSVLLD